MMFWDVLGCGGGTWQLPYFSCKTLESPPVFLGVGTLFCVVMVVFTVAVPRLVNFKTTPFVTLSLGHRAAQLCKVVI